MCFKVALDHLKAAPTGNFFAYSEVCASLFIGLGAWVWVKTGSEAAEEEAVLVDLHLLKAFRAPSVEPDFLLLRALFRTQALNSSY